MAPHNAGGGLQLVATVVGLVLVCSGLLLAFWPVGGTYDSEGFSCGSTILGTTEDGGYSGTEQYRACDRERTHLRWIALSDVALGLVLLGGVVWSARRR